MVWVGVVCSSPGRRLTFSENPGKISSPSQNPENHRQRILGILGSLYHQTASFAVAPIMPREEAGSMSCDSAACEDYGPQRGDRGAGEPQKERVPDLGAGTGCWNWLPDRAG